MKKQILVAAALWAVGAQAQNSGPNRIGPGTSPGTFQSPSSPAPSTSAPSPATSAPRPSTTAPLPSISGPAPSTSAPAPSVSGQVPAATAPAPSSAFETNRPPVVNVSPTINDTLGAQSRNSTNGLVSATSPQTGVLPSEAIGSSDGTARNAVNFGANGTNATSELTTTGVKVPPRVNEQPLDRALSAKIRAQLSASRPDAPRGAVRVTPESVRDLRITSQNGKVILEGSVDDAQQKALVEQSARQVQGVGTIENRLTLRNGQAVGAPAPGQSGHSFTNSSTKANSSAISGQTPRNSADLEDRHPEIAPR